MLIWLFLCACFQTGEGVRDARKGLCANHMSTIANFLKVKLVELKKKYKAVYVELHLHV